MTHIKYYESPLGALELTATDTHLTHVLFQQAQKRPSRQLQETSESSWIIDECIRQFDAYFRGELKDFDFPLLPHGTEFQKLVWENLKTIPYGKTISYLQLSR